VRLEFVDWFLRVVEKGLLTYVLVFCVGVKRWYTSFLVLKKTKNGLTTIAIAIVNAKTVKMSKPQGGNSRLFLTPLFFVAVVGVYSKNCSRYSVICA
jgi:hypothetical protein